MLLFLWKKWFGSTRHQKDSSAADGVTLENQVMQAQQGDTALREELILRYQPFVAKSASKFCRRYIDPERDDEFSIALTAFNEAIERYSPGAGSRFLGFAETVIVRRLIDESRKERRLSQALPYSAFGDGEGMGESSLQRAELREARDAYKQKTDTDDRRDEIMALTDELAVYGIAFADLVRQSPKHRDSRDSMLAIGRRLAARSSMMERLREKRQLPVKELCEAEQVSRKTIERHRKYLIAVSLIASGPYPFLSSYIGITLSEKKEVTVCNG